MQSGSRLAIPRPLPRPAGGGDGIKPGCCSKLRGGVVGAPAGFIFIETEAACSGNPRRVSFCIGFGFIAIEGAGAGKFRVGSSAGFSLALKGDFITGKPRIGMLLGGALAPATKAGAFGEKLNPNDGNPEEFATVIDSENTPASGGGGTSPGLHSLRVIRLQDGQAFKSIINTAYHPKTMISKKFFKNFELHKT